MNLKSISYILILASCLLSACDKPEPTLCMINKTNHRVYFWIIDTRWFNYYEHCCDVSFEQDSKFFWRAQFPGNDIAGNPSTDIFTQWEGVIQTGSEDIDFEFTDQSGSVVFDFRDSIVGNYNFTLSEIELSPVFDTVSVLTKHLTGSLSKDVAFNQLNIDIGTTLKEKAIFDTFLGIFHLEGGPDTGHTNRKDTVEFKIATNLPNGNTNLQIFNGIKM